MDFEHDITKLCHDGSHYVIITRVTSWICDFIVWWPVWVHRCDSNHSDRVPSDRSRCTVGFGWPASVYLYSTPLLDQNARLFSISDVKICCFIIRYRRLTLDFFVQIVFLTAVHGQRGVNRGSIGSARRIGMLLEQKQADFFYYSHYQVSLIVWYHGMMPASWIWITEPWKSYGWYGVTHHG